MNDKPGLASVGKIGPDGAYYSVNTGITPSGAGPSTPLGLAMLLGGRPPAMPTPADWTLPLLGEPMPPQQLRRIIGTPVGVGSWTRLLGRRWSDDAGLAAEE